MRIRGAEGLGPLVATLLVVACGSSGDERRSANGSAGRDVSGAATGGTAPGGASGRGGGNSSGAGAAAHAGSAGTGGNSGLSGAGGGASGGTAGATPEAGTSSGGIGPTSGGAAGQAASAGSFGTAGMGGAPLVCPEPPATGQSFVVDEGGVTFTLSSGRLRLAVCADDVFRVEYTTAAQFSTTASLSVNKVWAPPTFCVTAAGGTVTLGTARLKAKVDTASGLVSYLTADDQPILSEAAKSLTPASVEGVATNKVQTSFDSPADEALFGLGQHQDGVMNLKGKNQHLLNANTQINVPLLVSNRGYGVFWDNYSSSDFYGGDTNNTRFRYQSEAGDMVDYYVFYGPSLDHVIALYRTATGSAPLFPQWAYGLFQSKDKYGSASELLNVKNGYRNAKIPVDVIVQDWDYWTPYVWGSHYMDASRYPDPAALIAELHDAHVHTMISIWPLYQTASSEKKAGELDNFEALDAIGALFTSGGSHHFYDTFDADARTLVFQQIDERLLGKYGWDAIWADNTEPQAYPDSVNVRAADTALGKGALVINAYPLQHNKGLYEGWRKVGPGDKRVYILSRSGFAGQQRYAAACWSGDIDCDFPTFAKQIPGGLNYALAGMPYWTTDIGGYWGHDLDWSSSANNELFTRWFQFGAFCPIFRIHGGGSRELYGNQWSATTKANLLAIDQLRYRLMPYVYSLAWKVTSEGYTLMRHLVFDYPKDKNVFDIKDQFMFGPALLVSPVLSAGATSRNVYLPAGTWYDFWTGAQEAGGRTASFPAPLSELPLFVRAGSILPLGPNIQYATESADPVELRVYPGADATFTLYEDAGDTYAYEAGKYATVTLRWNDAERQLTIGAREGSYDGMLEGRTFNVVVVRTDHGAGGNVTSAADQTVTYTGSELVMTLPQ
jgi:alpha-D-xyloside xylohydrolase